MSAALLDNLAKIAGADNAFAFKDERAKDHRRVFGAIGGLKSDIAGVVRPATALELQAAVRAIHAAGLRSLSTPNIAGNGAEIERGEGALIVVDLSRLNRIVELDGARAHALVEPGVTYRQLHDRLRAEGLAPWLDCGRDPDHSILGGIRARDYGYTPYGDRFGMQCGMEVVLPDGGLVRTGMGALPGSNTWQMFKYNFGPYVDGIFTQSDLAIPVKAGVWLMPPPPKSLPFLVEIADTSGIVPLVEALRPLRINNTLPNPVRIAHRLFDAAPYRGRDGVGDGAAWRVYGALYDMPRNVEILWGAVEAALSAVPGARIVTEADPGDPSWAEHAALMLGDPPPRGPDFSRWGGPSSMRLTAAAPIEGGHALAMHEIATATVKREGVDYLSEYVLSSRTLFKHIYLPYNADDAKSRKRALAAGSALIGKLGAAGFGLAGETIELRLIADEQTRNTPMAGLVSLLRSALSGSAG